MGIQLRSYRFRVQLANHYVVHACAILNSFPKSISINEWLRLNIIRDLFQLPALIEFGSKKENEVHHIKAFMNRAEIINEFSW